MSKRVKTIGMLMALMAWPCSAIHVGAVTAANGVQSVQQETACKGVVTDAAGEPIIGATIRVQGTSTGTVTDFDGNFSLTKVAKGVKLEISSIGYVTKTVTWNGKDIRVTLEEDLATLGEETVTG